MNYVVFDLEATCWENRSIRPNEIIEIGAVLINEEAEVVSEFVTFVRPKVHPVLSDFCTELTSITQSQVDKAPEFPEALEMFREWFGYGKEDYFLCSWGFYDRKQLTSDCQRWEIETDWLRPHMSVKHQHGDLLLSRPLGMAKALEKEGFSLEGTHHRGIDDARNISKIFLKYFDLWQFEEK